MKRYERVPYKILEDTASVIIEEYDFDDIPSIHKDTTLYKFSNHDNEVLYVGITNNFTNRYLQHKFSKEWIDEVHNIYVSEPLTRNEAHMYEIYYISLDKPRYNNHFASGSIVDVEMEELMFYKWK